MIAVIAAADAIACHLPAYSPNFNPIEAMWSMVKELLRSNKARTGEELVCAIGAGLPAVATAGAAGWFAHCGYGNTE